MTELMEDIDPGKLPPRIRATFVDVAQEIAKGWKPAELADRYQVPASVVSESIEELRVALGLMVGVFPRPPSEQREELLRSIADQGVLVPVVLDERGIIDGFVRAWACEELAWICKTVTQHPDWQQIGESAEAERTAAVAAYGRRTVEKVERLVKHGPDLVALALERRWENPPTDRRASLNVEERRQLAVTLNAHRRQLSRGQLRTVIEMELMLDPSRSNRQIARLVGCAHSWVSDIRLQLEEDEQVWANLQAGVEVVGTDHVVAFRPVAELDCPHCHRHVHVLRGGREFQLEPGQAA